MPVLSLHGFPRQAGGVEVSPCCMTVCTTGGWRTRSFVKWEQVLSVRSYEALHGPIIRIGFVGLGNNYLSVASMSRPFREIEVRGRLLSVDPVLAYHALRYYHEHPEARVELADGTAVRRLRRDALSVSRRPS